MVDVDYARIGARTRYSEIAQEMRNIQDSFPGIEKDIREAGLFRAAAGVKKRKVGRPKKLKSIFEASGKRPGKAPWP
jgi:hypothetical protein